MKKILFILSAVILVCPVLIIYLTLPRFQQKEVIYIAVAGPMSGEDKVLGTAMLKGINLYLDQINEKGGINGRKIELLPFDDRGDIRTAMKVATAITDENKALLVLGHLYSATSIAAGEIYKNSGIPAVTPSASADLITRGNEWYFRVIPNDIFIAGFIGNYIKTFNKKTASIIFEEGSYGSLMAEHFEEAAKKNGIEIKKKMGFNRDDKNLLERLNEIIAELRATDDPGVIFFAAYPHESSFIITSLKYPGTDYIMIGPTLGGKIFINDIKEYPLEKASPGYYSDGIYGVSPFILDIGDENANEFRRKFVRKYNEEPDWIAACSYDAMHVVADAIEKAEIECKKESLRADRRIFRESLTGINSKEFAVKGATGYIYFDSNRNVSYPMSVGIYQKQRLLPAFSQYKFLSEIKDVDETVLKDSVKDKIIVVNEKVMTKTQVVYTGIDINEISNLNMKNATCTIDFYLWFRFQDDFDDANIIFTNAVQSIKPEKRIMDEREGNTIIRAYHIKADFKSDFDFHKYPFDSQIINLRFRHAYRIKNSLIYVPDIIGMPPADKKNIGKIFLNAVTGWNINEILYYQNIVKDSSVENDFTDLKDIINYSQFNFDIKIEKKEKCVIFKTFFPIIVLVLILYTVYFLPSYRLTLRCAIFIIVPFITVAYRFIMLSDMKTDSLPVIDYAFFTIYILSAVAGLISLLTYRSFRHENKNKVKIFNRLGKITHITGISIAILLLCFNIFI